MFALTYCKPVDIGLATTLSLKEKHNHDCIFLESTGCRVYPARPAQCRTYPFWEQKIGGSNPLVPIKNYVNVMLAKCACYLETVT